MRGVDLDVGGVSGGGGVGGGIAEAQVGVGRRVQHITQLLAADSVDTFIEMPPQEVEAA